MPHPSHQLLPSRPIPWHFSSLTGGGVTKMSHLRVSPQQLLLLSTWASSESAVAAGHRRGTLLQLLLASEQIYRHHHILKAFWQTCNVNFTKARKIFPTRAYHLSNHRILRGFAVKDVDSILRSRPSVQKAIAHP